MLIPPGQPTITAPADPATDRTPTVEWDPVAGGDTYDLLMYSLETGREAANASGIEATAYTVTQTLDFARYQTFVRAVNCAGEPGLWGLHTFEVIPPTVTITADDPDAFEEVLDPGILTVSRSESIDDPLDVLYFVSGTATRDSDYVALSGIVSIPANETSATMVVAPMEDAIEEDDETVTVTLDDTDLNYLPGAQIADTVTIVDGNSPVDLDADSDNDSAEPLRPPSESDFEDRQEFATLEYGPGMLMALGEDWAQFKLKATIDSPSQLTVSASGDTAAFEFADENLDLISGSLLFDIAVDETSTGPWFMYVRPNATTADDGDQITVSAVLQDNTTAEQRHDELSVTAKEQLVDMDVYHGQNFPYAVDENWEDDPPAGKKWVTGAVTVANLNDTDGDGITDKDDSIVMFAQVKLTQPVAVGATSLAVESVEGYAPSEVIAIKTVDASKDEVVTVQSVNATTKTLTLKAGTKNAYAVNDLVYHRGRSELDLMKIVLRPPKPFEDGGTVTLSKVSGNIKVWSDPQKKGEPITLPKTWTKTQFGTGITLWVEATAASTSLRDIALKMTYKDGSGTEKGTPDIVKASGVWVTLEQRPANQGKNPWHKRQTASGFPENPKPGHGGDLPDVSSTLSSTINDNVISKDGSRYGFGTFDKDSNGEDQWIGGRILHEFLVGPAGVDDVGENLDSPFSRPIIAFDATRQLQSRMYTIKSGEGDIKPVTVKMADYPETSSQFHDAPRDIETVTDDKVASDEDNDISSRLNDHHIYSWDFPSIARRVPDLAFMIQRVNFREWVRIKIGLPSSFTHKNWTVEGSRSSSNSEWYIQNYVRLASTGFLETDTASTSASAPNITGKGEGTISVQTKTNAVTEGFTVSFDGTQWTLTGTQGHNATKGGGSPWVLEVTNVVKVTITQTGAVFEKDDKFTFSVFKTSASGGKKGALGLGQTTVTDGP